MPVAAGAVDGRARPGLLRPVGDRAPVVFMGAIVFVLWRTLKVMPKTKPVQIKPQANLEVGWDDIAGVDEAKYELQEVVEFLRDEKRFKRLGAKRAQGRAAARAAGHRQDAARQGGRPGVRRAVLLAVGVLVRRDVRRPRRRPHPPPVRRGAQAPPGDHLHRRARRRRRPARLGNNSASASRRSTSCWSRWTASPAPAGSS